MLRVNRMVVLGFAICATLVVPRVAGSGESPAGDANPASLDLLRSLEGKWRGTGQGASGSGTVERTYELVMDGRFLLCRSVSTYPPQPKNEKGERHEEWGLYSVDRARGKLVMRQFHNPGFVHQCVLDRVSDEGREIVFVTDAIENLPAGFRGRETYRREGNDRLVETFEFASPGKDYELFVTNTLERVR